MSKHTNSSRVGSVSVQAIIPLIVLVMLSIASFKVAAIPVENLYVADVLVTDEGNAQRRTGARAGLLQVLTRVSGSLNVEESALIRESLRTPEAYYNQYSYESTETSLLSNGQAIEARRLRLSFDPSAVARLLRDAELPVWGSNRPGVLLWIAINDETGRRILSESDTGIVPYLVDQALERGVPLLFPILDIEDAGRISAAEVWGAFLDRVELASSRYAPDTILTGRIQQDGPDRWSGRWSYQLGDGWQSVESAAFSSDALVRNMVNKLSDELAARFALGSDRNSVRLIIEGVETVQDYAALSGYLEKLTPVLASSIVSLDGSNAEFELQTEGQYAQLVEIIELDERLVLLQQDEKNERLVYRWAQ